MQTCFECELFKKHEREKRLTKVFKWHIFAEDKPTEPIEYLVCIDGAKLATTLIYDGQIESFVDVDGVPYNVKYWGNMPELPKFSEER